VAGLLTLTALIVAFAAANSPLSGIYDVLHHLPLTVRVGDLGPSKPLVLWVNDGLMVFFFLLVAVETKREILVGHLSSASTAAGPLLGAVGGILVPASIYVALNGTEGATAPGWPIPVATDIVLALTVLSLLSDRVPASTRVFLTVLAVFDDLAAIAIVALYYTASLSSAALAVAFLAGSALAALNRAGVSRPWAYGVVGAILWAALVRAGIHGTLAGVAVGFAVPLRSRAEDPLASSPLLRLERRLHPWVAFGIVPAFAFFNSGIRLTADDLGALLDPMPLGVILGLAVGKPLGILGGVFLGVVTRLVSLPQGTHWRHLVGAALAGGVGFTMSLFIAGLAFADPVMFRHARLSVVLASVISGAAAALLIRTTCRRVAESTAVLSGRSWEAEPVP